MKKIFFLLFYFCSLSVFATGNINKNIIIFGCPGAGKTTFCSLLHLNGYENLAVGKILRKNIMNRTPFGIKYKNEIFKGEALPKGSVSKILFGEIKKCLKRGKPFIVDGYPWSIEEAIDLKKFIIVNNLHDKIYFVIFNIDHKTAKERISQRYICEKCLKSYTRKEYLLNMKCTICGIQLNKRHSDLPDYCDEKINHYFSSTIKVIKFLKKSFNFIELNCISLVERQNLLFYLFKKDITIKRAN